MTSDHDALYRSICLHPDEDIPRIAFADLIEEEGDSFRAAFIRAQVELARVPEYDPFAVKCRQFHPEFINGWAMAHTLPRLPAGFPFKWNPHEFRRGFPWTVGVQGRCPFVEHLPVLFELAPVQSLALDDSVLGNDSAFHTSPHLARLRRLEWSASRFSATPLADLGNSPHLSGLTELSLTSGDIDIDGLRELSRSPLFSQLESLEVRHTLTAPELLIDALAGPRQPGRLWKLVLRENQLTPQDAAHLFSLPVARGLIHLELLDNKLNADGVVSLVESGILGRLHRLNLRRTFPGVPGVKALANANGLTGLRSLDLSANRLGPVAIKTLAEASGFRGLRVLRLRENPIGPSGAKALAACPHLSELLELDLENCGIDDAGTIALAESPYFDGLLRLIVRDYVTGRERGDAARAALKERFGERVTM